MSTPGQGASGTTVLAVDLGATNLRLAAVWRAGASRSLQLGTIHRLAAADYPSLAAALQACVAMAGGAGAALRAIDAVGVGVPGPVTGRTARITNLPWTVDADELARVLGMPVVLLNDLEAQALGAVVRGPAACTTLRAGTPDPVGNAAMIAPGTGLGEALLLRDARGELVPRASEGAHASFAPVTDEDAELWRFLRTRYEHVSWERVVSGRDGLRNVFDFLVATGRIEVPAADRDRLQSLTDIGGELLTAATAGHRYALAVLERFAWHLGAEAGNLALKALATGGVYVGGNLAARVFELVPFQGFLDGFAAKGRFRDLLTAMPIYRVDDADIGLVGAGARAAALVGQAWPD